MSVFVVIDDWGYDGQTDIGVAASLEAAKALAASDAATERAGTKTLREWAEKPDAFMAKREWTANCRGSRDYVIREHDLKQ